MAEDSLQCINGCESDDVYPADWRLPTYCRDCYEAFWRRAHLYIVAKDRYGRPIAKLRQVHTLIAEHEVPQQFSSEDRSRLKEHFEEMDPPDYLQRLREIRNHRRARRRSYWLTKARSYGWQDGDSQDTK